MVVNQRSIIGGIMLMMMAMAIMLMVPSMAEENISDHLDVQIRLMLKSLNKPSVKSIKTTDGDIIDCVHISKQPAFDHPLLKNHTIQMEPSILPENTIPRNLSSDSEEMMEIDATHLWDTNEECPDNTIPIRRTKRSDLLRANSIETFGKKNSASAQPNDIRQLSRGHEHAVAGIRQNNMYGTKAILSVWNPHVDRPNEFSLSQMWVLGGPMSGDLNTLEAGWHVDPILHGDRRTRFFIFWTNDGYKKSGCYNNLCPGFVQTNKQYTFGRVYAHMSAINGPQYIITLQIYQDPASKHWWLIYRGKPMGYWPAELFPHLSRGANIIEWGGEVVNTQFNGAHTTTTMGSGRFAGEGYKKASYIRSIELIDSSMRFTSPKKEQLQVVTEKPGCYDVKIGHGAVWGTNIYFGGPGRNPRCP